MRNRTARPAGGRISFFSAGRAAPLVPRLARRPLFTSLFFAPGYLVSVDSYMNLQLASTEEWIDGQFSGNLGEVLIRCNNVLYLRGVPEEEEGS